MKPAKRHHPKRRKTIRHAQVIADRALPPAPLSITRTPQLILAEAQEAIEALKGVLARCPDKVVYNGESFLRYEHWQIVGRFFGIVARPHDAEPIVIGDHHGFKATADAILISTGQVISGADAVCMTDEAYWSHRQKYLEGENGRRIPDGDPEPVPNYQRASMAQTRACSKAIRNVCAWVAKLAGYSVTPAEEIVGNFEHDISLGSCVDCGKSLYFTDEAKRSLCRECRANKDNSINKIADHNFVKDSVAAVEARRKQFQQDATRSDHAN
jgi:hypothetical protein